MLTKLWLRVLRATAPPWIFLMSPSLLPAAGGGGESIVFVADSRLYEGIWHWFASLYNESAVWFTIVTVVTIPVAGALLGLLADCVMRRIGIDLESRTIGEH